MENLAFNRENNSFKESKLQRVIRSKISDVSDVNLQKIIQGIDIEQQYFIKATRNPKKFLNTITHEDVCCDERLEKSVSYMLYGEGVPGLFVDLYGKRHSSSGFLNHAKPAAAIKSIVKIIDNQPVETEYLLVIYEPKRSVDSDLNKYEHTEKAI